MNLKMSGTAGDAPVHIAGDLEEALLAESGEALKTLLERRLEVLGRTLRKHADGGLAREVYADCAALQAAVTAATKILLGLPCASKPVGMPRPAGRKQ